MGIETRLRLRRIVSPPPWRYGTKCHYRERENDRLTRAAQERIKTEKWCRGVSDYLTVSRVFLACASSIGLPPRHYFTRWQPTYFLKRNSWCRGARKNQYTHRLRRFYRKRLFYSVATPALYKRWDGNSFYGCCQQPECIKGF